MCNPRVRKILDDSHYSILHIVIYDVMILLCTVKPLNAEHYLEVSGIREFVLWKVLKQVRYSKMSAV